MKRRKSPVKLGTRIRSALRKVWRYSGHRSEALRKARVGFGRYKCAECAGSFGPRDVAVDHVDACGAFNNETLDGLEQFAKRLFFNRLQILCHECHAPKTAKERAARKKAA